MKRALDFADVRGQHDAIAVVEQAVRERANVLLLGPPGLGATAIAQRITTILPELSDHEHRWVAAELGALDLPGWTSADVERPFRSPHHTISSYALVGVRRPDSVSRRACFDVPTLRTVCRCHCALPAHTYHSLPIEPVPRAGELQLARHGVLFLDEVPEFNDVAIKALASAWLRMPTEIRPMLVASATPCACGWYGTELRDCLCSGKSVERHRQRVDRFRATLEMQLVAPVRPLSLRDMRDLPPGDTSAAIRARLAQQRPVNP